MIKFVECMKIVQGNFVVKFMEKQPWRGKKFSNRPCKLNLGHDFSWGQGQDKCLLDVLISESTKMNINQGIWNVAGIRKEELEKTF